MKSNDFLKEDIVSDAQDMHLDHEVQMARQECYHAAENAITLHKLLRHMSEQQGLEGWVSAKITLAADYLKTVREHLEYQLMAGASAAPEEQDPMQVVTVAENVITAEDLGPVDEASVGNRMSDIQIGSPKIVYYKGRAVGEVGIDHEASPGNGPFYMKHYLTGKDMVGYDTKKEALADLKHMVMQELGEGQQWPDSSNSLAKRSTVATNLKGAPEKAGRTSGMTVATRVDPTITSTKVQRKDANTNIPSFLKKDVEEGEVYDLEKEYGYEKPKAQRRSVDPDSHNPYPYTQQQDDDYFREIWRKKREAAKKAEQEKGINETSAGSVAGVVNPTPKNKAKVGSLFGGTYKQKKVSK